MARELLALAAIERRAIGRDRHDHVVGAVVEMLGELDRGDDVGKPGNADVVEGGDQARVELRRA